MACVGLYGGGGVLGTCDRCTGAMAVRGLGGASSGCPGMMGASPMMCTSCLALLVAGSRRAGFSLIASSYVGGAPATVS